MTPPLKWIDDEYVTARQNGEGEHWELGSTELWQHDLAYVDAECLSEFATQVEILNKAMADWTAATQSAKSNSGDSELKAIAIGKGESVGWQAGRVERMLYELRSQIGDVLPQQNSSHVDYTK